MSMHGRAQLKSEGPGPGSGQQTQQDSYHQFPAGLKVLVVDDDPLCLKIVEHQLKRLAGPLFLIHNSNCADCLRESPACLPNMFVVRLVVPVALLKSVFIVECVE
jgi:hypothetical protein